MDILAPYFPQLDARQLDQFRQLPALYAYWNERINVISRKDIENIEERHILHSLAIAKLVSFSPGTKTLDVGTGGGFPGIPLAIMFPEARFTLVDSTGKKIRVVREIADAIGLENVECLHARAETLKDKYDFIVSRAVTKLPRFIAWVRNKVAKENRNTLPNGILYLKGGDLEAELRDLHQPYKIVDLAGYFKGDFFQSKKLVYIPFSASPKK